jgi:hypothetical protein
MTPEDRADAAHYAAQRKAAERKRRKEAGLVRVEVWVKPEHRKAVSHYAERLSNGTLVYLSDVRAVFDAETCVWSLE